MKKVANISLTLTYVLFTIGIAISSHYCMGEISHQDVFSFDNHGCMCDDVMGDEDDCCNDEIAIVTIDGDQQVSSQIGTMVPKLSILFVFNTEQFAKTNLTSHHLAFVEYYDDPPSKATQPLYLLNCNYTFYG